MSYEVEDRDNIKEWKVFFTLYDGERDRIRSSFKIKEDAEKEAARHVEGRISPVYGRKTIKTEYPTCPKCGHQGESTGVREHNYNGGGEYFRCLNLECKHNWCWS